MSRVGKKPVPMGDAKVSIDGRQVTVESSKARLSLTHRPEVTVRVDDENKQVVVERNNESRKAYAMHGLTRALLANMVQGVTQGFTQELEITGVGWTAQVQGKTLNLNIGFADTRQLTIPDSVSVEVQQNRIKVSGADKQAVGQFAAQVRGQRPPEPYNGKGIKYAEEVITRKEGKAFSGG